MKQIFITLLALIGISMNAHATAQASDIIYINGEKWKLRGKPICFDKDLHDILLNTLPKDRIISSANWFGYIAAWSINDNTLTLDSIIISVRNKTETLDNALLDQVLEQAGYHSRTATWVKGTIFVADGKIIKYIHQGYESIFEHERFLDIENGIVVSDTTYHNKILVEGFSSEDLHNSILDNEDHIKQHLHIDFSKYPLLAKRHNRFTITNITVDNEGTLTNCEVTIEKYKKDDELTIEQITQLENEVKQTLMSIKPWKTMLFSNKVTPFSNSIQFIYPSLSESKFKKRLRINLDR